MLLLSLSVMATEPVRQSSLFNLINYYCQRTKHLNINKYISHMCCVFVTTCKAFSMENALQNILCLVAFLKFDSNENFAT